MDEPTVRLPKRLIALRAKICAAYDAQDWQRLAELSQQMDNEQMIFWAKQKDRHEPTKK